MNNIWLQTSGLIVPGGLLKGIQRQVMLTPVVAGSANRLMTEDQAES
jgi:hypothetical protein